MMLLSFTNLDDSNLPVVDVDKLRALMLLSQAGEVSIPTRKKKKKNAKINNIKKILSSLNLESEEDDSEEIINRLMSSQNGKKKKTAKKVVTCQEREQTVKIASKEIKDSHYQVDVSKDVVEKDGLGLIMVSAYFRDAYLGRYLIKRNYYFYPDNEDGADETFDEICGKMKKIKKNYYSGKTNVKSIFSDVHKTLHGIISDIKFDDEDELGTTVKRN